MPWSAEVPYNDLPPLPPAGLDLEPKAVLKATVEARSAGHRGFRALSWGAPGRNRTCDTRFRKPMLYPLSYGGVDPPLVWALVDESTTRKVTGPPEATRMAAGNTMINGRWELQGL